MARATILYDGWPLVYQPGQPPALHLLALLERHPSDIPAAVALPGEPVFPLSEGLAVRKAAARQGDFGLLAWEQRTLPQLAETLNARLIHRTLGGPALSARRKTLVSPAEFGAGGWFEASRQSRRNFRPRDRLAARLREALIVGGMGRSRGVLWPSDLPPLDLDVPVFNLPPVVPGAFWKASPDQANIQHLELPETYVIYHGPLPARELRRLLAAWSWAAGTIGQDYPLVILGVGDAIKSSLEAMIEEYGLAGTVRSLPPLPLEDMASLYQRCSALVHPAPVSPWGGPLHLALACGKPVVGYEDRLSDAIAGPAAYLAAKDDSCKANSRALGAALVTVLVEEGMADALSAQARQRAAGWKTFDQAGFSQHLRAVYQLLAAG